MTTFVFTDTETTSLRHDRRAWEIGAIVREEGKDDTEHSWLIDVSDLDLGNADPKSLEIGGFYDRHPDFDPARRDQFAGALAVPEWSAAREFEALTRGATIVAANVGFDAEVLANMFRRNDFCPSWHYRLFDIESYAAGALGLPMPVGLDKLLAAYGLTHDDADRHTALGDARRVRDLYDAVRAGKTGVAA